ncbi:3-hydroxybutyrate dehydrogenase [Elongatibacter sediminis]|uniref:3-hydroxybutyrate dehydrogenase n=1 Tax=Elongatibacter sediminis TaxID=3119006 RepID=A0AAW9REQ9_9GAMM
MGAEQSLRGRQALVTGSTSGIGLGIARALAKAGCNLTLNGFGDAAEIESIRADLAAEAAVEVAYDGADMRRPADIEAMVDGHVERFGGLDILVNNAGIQHVSPVEEFPVDKWDDIIAINLSSSFHTIRAAISGMAERGWGRVINVASAHALVASPFKAAYVAAKHGVAGLTKTVALEYAEKGVTVNAIAPGYVETPLVTGQIADTARARGISEEEVVRDVMLLAQPTRKLITIEQVAAMALYLCSDAAGAVTGTVLSIDGGWTAK